MVAASARAVVVDLVPDAWLAVALFLHHDDVLAASSSCRALRAVLLGNGVWEWLLRRDFAPAVIAAAEKELGWLRPGGLPAARSEREFFAAYFRLARTVPQQYPVDLGAAQRLDELWRFSRDLPQRSTIGQLLVTCGRGDLAPSFFWGRTRRFTLAAFLHADAVLPRTCRPWQDPLLHRRRELLGGKRRLYWKQGKGSKGKCELPPDRERYLEIPKAQSDALCVLEYGVGDSGDVASPLWPANAATARRLLDDEWRVDAVNRRWDPALAFLLAEDRAARRVADCSGGCIYVAGAYGVSVLLTGTSWWPVDAAVQAAFTVLRVARDSADSIVIYPATYVAPSSWFGSHDAVFTRPPSAEVLTGLLGEPNARAATLSLISRSTASLLGPWLSSQPVLLGATFSVALGVVAVLEGRRDAWRQSLAVAKLNRFNGPFAVSLAAHAATVALVSFSVMSQFLSPVFWNALAACLRSAVALAPLPCVALTAASILDWAVPGARSRRGQDLPWALRWTAAAVATRLFFAACEPFALTGSTAFNPAFLARVGVADPTNFDSCLLLSVVAGTSLQAFAWARRPESAIESDGRDSPFVTAANHEDFLPRSASERRPAWHGIASSLAAVWAMCACNSAGGTAGACVAAGVAAKTVVSCALAVCRQIGRQRVYNELDAADALWCVERSQQYRCGAFQ